MDNRTQNVALNTKWAVINQLITATLGFVNRKLFLSVLGPELLGVNSLFSDLLLLFSFADLGFGSAIMFSLYKPIAQNDTAKVQALLKLYRKVYFYVLLVIGSISIGFIPFLGFLNTDITVENLRIYYIFFQINNLIEYVWAYRTSYVIASQQARRLSVIGIIFSLVKNLVQILVLFVIRDYIWYLAAGTMCVLLKEIINSQLIKKWYPITEISTAGELSKEEKKKLYTKTMALFITKAGNLLINQTDSLIVSYIINVVQWGFASNYLLLKNTVFLITEKVYSSVLPSMGNLVAADNRKKELIVFLKYDFLNAWMHTFCFIAFSCLSSLFIRLFFGTNVLLGEEFVYVFYFASFLDGLRCPVSVLREATGSYEKDKWFTLIAAAINLIVSIPLALIWGLVGVYIGTISAMLTLHISRSYILFKDHVYDMTMTGYMIELLKHMIVAVILLIITKITINMIISCLGNGMISLIIASIIVLIIPNAIWCVLYHKDHRFKYVISLVMRRIRRHA